MARRLPERVKRGPRALLARAEYAWRYELKWPAPLWRVKGGAWIELDGNRLRFEGVGRRPHVWWAQRAYRQSWEQAVIAFFAETLRPGDTVLDIGAYVGPYALLASRLVGRDGHVYAFEPDPVARALLIRNVAANSAENVTVLPWAVADRLGTVWLDSGSLGNANTAITPVSGQIRASTVTLASFCQQLELTPDLIKIDVEGGEAEIVTDEATEVLRRARAVVIEVHEVALAARGIELEQYLDRLRRTGKELVTLETRAQGNFNVALR